MKSTLTLIIFLSTFYFAHSQGEIIKLTDFYQDYLTATLVSEVVNAEASATEIIAASKIWVIKNISNEAILDESSTSLTFEWSERLNSDEIGFNRVEEEKFKAVIQARDNRYKLTIIDIGSKYGETKDKPLKVLFQDKKTFGKAELTGNEFLTSKEGHNFKIVSSFKSRLDSKISDFKTYIADNLDW